VRDLGVRRRALGEGESLEPGLCGCCRRCDRAGTAGGRGAPGFLSGWSSNPREDVVCLCI